MALALSDLRVPVGSDDHVRGPMNAPVTIVEYGDYECPHCGRAYWSVKELLEEFSGEVAFVYRNFPLTHEHPRAETVAEALEAAAGQGRFWDAHDWFYEHQHQLEVMDLERHAGELGLDVDRWNQDVRTRTSRGKVQADLESGRLSGVTGTPTFFVNGTRLEVAPDLETLRAAVLAARERDLRLTLG